MPYTAAQRGQLKEDFGPVLLKYRRLKRITIWIMAGAFAATVLPFLGRWLLGPSAASWPFSPVGLFFPAFIALFAISFRMRALLKCPGCTQQLETLGTYCPECGHAGLVPAVSGWFSTTPAHCTACGKDMTIKSSGKGGTSRQYTIHACSSCGLYLDEKGV